MKQRAYRIVNAGVIATIFVLSMSLLAEADVTDGPAAISPCNYDPNPDWYLNFTTDVALGSSYKLYDWHGGTWCDAEKTADNAEDNLLCWAAAACNVMNWTGWGFVINGTQYITNEDEMFRHFQDHWEDQGALASVAWKWWFDGGYLPDYPNDPPYNGGPAAWAEVDVAGGGDFWTPPYNVDDYMHSYRGAETLQHIDTYLHNGWGVALGIYNGGHAITCWGFNYNNSVDKGTDPEDYYLGIWVTDSDDNKGSNAADPPPDSIRYYNVSYNSTSSRWEMPNYGGGWYIEAVYALEPFPNTVPVADAGTPYTGDEGSLTVFSGTGSYDNDSNPLRYRWDFDNNGIWDTVWSSNPTASHTYPDDYSGLVVLQVSDYITAITDTASVTISNVAPSVNAGSDQTVNEGDTVTFSGGFTDPGTGDTHTIEWNFGDGSTTTGTLTPTHVYGDNGVYTVTLTVTDDDGGTDTDTMQVTVQNLNPTISPLSTFTVDENSLLTISATATDAGSDDLTFTWSWGDGSPDMVSTYYNDGTNSDPYPSPGGTYPFTATNNTGHIYGDDYTYTVTLTVTDDDGGSTTMTTTVTVNNVNPFIGPLNTYTVDENMPVSVAATATDPGSDDLTFSWNWGDGTPDTVSIYYNDGMNPDVYPSPNVNPITASDTVTHTYGDNGVYIVTLTVTDDDGGSTTMTTTVTVNNVNPTITAANLTLPYPDNPEFILPIIHTLPFTATAVDPGSDDLVFNWSWGDGTYNTTTYFNDGVADDPYPSPDVNPINVTDNASHVYATNGTYTVTLTVTDDDGGSATWTWTIKVLNAEEAKHDINDYIQNVSDDLFKGKAEKRKAAFDNMFNAVDDMLDEGEYWGAMQALENNIRSKCDGSVDGKAGDDWILGDTPEGVAAQWHICMKIDDLIAYLATFL